MKTRIRLMLLTGGLALVLLTAYAQTKQSPSNSLAGTEGVAPTSPAETTEPVMKNDNEPVLPAPGNTAMDHKPASETATETPGTFQPPVESRQGSNELRLNFRGAPIEMVLNYLSDAAGFIIEMNTPAKGKVDVWSSHPVSKDEAVDILNSVLNKNGYAAIRNGRILTIVSKADAIHADIPVKTGNDPAAIPRNDEIVTQIIPIRFVEAQQLVKDLSPLVSPHATIIANEAGNSIAVTDTQANIRHLVEIIKAIDSSAEDVAEIRVFHLKHHDPVEISTLLNGLFSGQGNATGVQAPFRFGGPGFGGAGFGGTGFGGFGGFGGGGAVGGGRGAGGAATAATANPQADRIKKRTQVVAVADPRTSSVVVTASKDMIGQIGGMIEQLDQDSPKVAHVSVIHLENADPQQVQQVLQDMFQSSTSTRNSSTQSSPLQNRITQNSGTTSSGATLGGSGLGSGTARSGAGF